MHQTKQKTQEMQNSRAAHGTSTKKRKDISLVNEDDTQIEVSNNAPKKASTTNKYGNRDHPRALAACAIMQTTSVSI